MLWVANGGRPRSSPASTCSSVICTSSCTHHCWIIHRCSFCCWSPSTYGLCKLQKCDKIFSFHQPPRLSVRSSVLPKGDLPVLSTAAASTNWNPKDLQCPCLSSAGPQLLPSTLDFLSKACRSILPWIIERNTLFPKEKLRELYIFLLVLFLSLFWFS